MRREFHVRFSEGLGVQFPRATRLVICCKPGFGPAAMMVARSLTTKLGLEMNEQKSRLVKLPEETFDFLGYTFGRFFGKDGQPYLGTAISKKAMKKVLGKIHDETSTRWITDPPEKRVKEVNQIVRGWCGYFDQGPVYEPYRRLRKYIERRMRRWLMKKHKRRGTGYRQYPDEFLYGKLGLFNPHVHRLSRARVKA